MISLCRTAWWIHGETAVILVTGAVWTPLTLCSKFQDRMRQYNEKLGIRRDYLCCLNLSKNIVTINIPVAKERIKHYFGQFLTVLLVHLQSRKEVELLSKLHTSFDNQAKYFGLVFMEHNPVGFYTVLGTVGRQLCAHTSFIILNTLEGYNGIEGISTNFALHILGLLSWYSSLWL